MKVFALFVVWEDGDGWQHPGLLSLHLSSASALDAAAANTASYPHKSVAYGTRPVPRKDRIFFGPPPEDGDSLADYGYVVSEMEVL